MKKTSNTNPVRNIISGWATTIVGIVTMIITLVLVWQKVFDFVWEGVAGLSIGTILLVTPRAVERAIIELIRSWGKRGNPYNNNEGGGDI